MRAVLVRFGRRRSVPVLIAAVLALIIATPAGAAYALSTLTTTPTPTITGTPRVGLTLTAVPGTWAPAPVTLSYQWLVAGTVVSGATTASYVPVTADVGKSVTVKVTGSKTGYTSVSKTSVATAAVAATSAFTSAPTPTISGTPQVGLTLTAASGTWAPAPVVLAYQWLAAGTAISGATGATYVPIAANVGKVITVKVTGSEAGYSTTSKTSAATAVVATTIAFTASPTPTITGTASVGLTLAAVPGTWAPAPVGLAYQWSAGGTAISGAISSTYVPVTANVGKTVTVAVTGTEAGYTTTTKTSVATSSVTAAAVFTSTPTPTISGTPTVGLTLTAQPSSWTPAPVTLAYQWSVGGVAVAGATSSTYLAAPGDVGKAVTVTVTGTESGYTTASKTSAATAPVTASQTFTAAPAPTISGTAAVGSVLEALPGNWTPAPVAFSFQWSVGGAAVVGATTPSYTPMAADLGSVISVTVTGTEPGYATQSKTSASTSAVRAGSSLAAPLLESVAGVGLGLLVGWAPSDAADNVASYSVTVTPVAGSTSATCVAPAPETQTTTAANSSLIVPQLCAGVAYTAQVSALNASGVGLASAPSLPAAPLVAQAPDSALIVAVTPRTGSLTASWADSGYNGGSSVTGFTLTALSGTTVVQTLSVPSTANNATLTGLTNGTEYTISLTTNNLIGASEDSSSPGTPEALYAPGSPPSVSASPDGNGNVVIAWSAPTDNGGAPVSGYTVSYQQAVQAADGTWSPLAGALLHTTSVGATLFSSTATNFEAPTATYLFTVAAFNSVGTGVAADSGTPISPVVQKTSGTVVLTDTDVNTIAAATTSSLTWTDPVPSDIAGLVQGSVIVAPAAGVLPEGGLFNVIDIADSGSATTLTISQAQLSQAFTNLSAGITENPITGDQDTTGQGSGSRSALGSGSGRATFVPEVGGVHVVPNDFGGSVTLSSTMTFQLNIHTKRKCDGQAGYCGSVDVNGQVSVTPKVQMGLNISQNAIGVPDGLSVSSALSVTTTTHLDVGLTGSYSLPIQVGEVDGEPITVPAGPVPVVLVPKVPIFLNVSGSAAIGFTSTMTVGGSIAWSSLNPSVLVAKSLNTGPKFAASPLPGLTLTGELFIGLEFRPQIDIYGIVGPDLDITAGIDIAVNFNPAPGQAFLTIAPKITFKAGFAIDVFGFQWQLDLDLATVTLQGWQLLSAPVGLVLTNPIPSFSAIGVPTDLSAITTTGGPAGTVTWAIVGGVSGDRITSSGIFTAAAPSGRVVTIKATNSSGNVGQIQINVGSPFTAPTDLGVIQQPGQLFTAQLSWGAPDSTAGKPVANYEVVTQPSTGTHITALTGLTLSGLAAGKYTATVYAIDSGGATSAPASTVLTLSRTGTLSSGYVAADLTIAPLPAGWTRGAPSAVSCFAAERCEAVGWGSNSSGATAFLAYQLVNNIWAVSAVPEPANVHDSAELHSVQCDASATCLATGTYDSSTTSQQGALARFSNGVWTSVQAPLPAGADAVARTNLSQSECTSATSCVVVGSYRKGGVLAPLIETLSGTTWTALAAPLPSGSVPSAGDAFLGGVSCDQAGQCVADGEYVDASGNDIGVIETLSGGVWTPTVSPTTTNAVPGVASLGAISCGVAGMCVSLAGYQTSAGKFRYSIDYSSGGAWSAIDAPLPSDADPTQLIQLFSDNCTGNVCQVVGSYTDFNGLARPLIDSFSSGGWSTTNLYRPADEIDDGLIYLSGIGCVSVGECVATGMYDKGVPSQPEGLQVTGFIEMLSGGLWSEYSVPVPSDAVQQGVNPGPVSCFSQTACVQVGSYQNPGGFTTGYFAAISPN